MSTRQERERAAEKLEKAERAAEKAVVKAPEPAKPVRATVRCGRCQEPCSQRGHLKGKEATPEGAKGYKLYECVRCGVYLEQVVCECCGVEVGALQASADDSAQEAAKRMEAR